MSQQPEGAMTSKFPVWSAVLAGMASPASLYTAPQNYQAYARLGQVAHGFTVAGSFLANSMAAMANDGQIRASAKARRWTRKA
jgi:hypothetical protein